MTISVKEVMSDDAKVTCTFGQKVSYRLGQRVVCRLGQKVVVRRVAAAA